MTARDMHFACSRCGHRQSEDASCEGCRNDVVQDLRDPRGRQVLRDAESRLHRQRLSRYIAVGAVFGILLAGTFYGLYYWTSGEDPGTPEDLVTRLPVAAADDLIVYKTVAWRDRDRADVERLLRLHGPTLDLARIRGLVAEFAEAIEEPGRIQDFELLVKKAFPGSS
jgi:hypothetical protein